MDYSRRAWNNQGESRMRYQIGIRKTLGQVIPGPICF
jgi:hypothetical protein